MHSHASTPIISASNLILNEFGGKRDTDWKHEKEEIKEKQKSNNFVPEVQIKEESFIISKENKIESKENA